MSYFEFNKLKVLFSGIRKYLRNICVLYVSNVAVEEETDCKEATTVTQRLIITSHILQLINDILAYFLPKAKNICLWAKSLCMNHKKVYKY